jgi:hypothetical protein
MIPFPEARIRINGGFETVAPDFSVWYVDPVAM